VFLPVIALLCGQVDVIYDAKAELLTELELRCQDPEQASHLICDDVQGEELNLDYPVEARPDTEEARSSARLHATLTGGMILTPSGATEFGPQLSLGKSLFFFTRHRHFQGLIDTRFGIQLALPSRRVGLTLSPTMGINWYFGTRVGFELRAGLGFGADLHPQVSRFGLAVPLGAAIVVRPFSDDRQRIKLGLVIDEHFLLFSSPMVITISMGVGLGFEMPFL
jgi:hypothetical protein